MKFKVILLIIAVMCFALIPTVAQAGIGDWINSAKSWMSGELLALLATAGVALLASVAGVQFAKVQKTFAEFGEFMTTLSNALDDRKITNDELRAIVKEGKDIFAVWRGSGG